LRQEKLQHFERTPLRLTDAPTPKKNCDFAGRLHSSCHLDPHFAGSEFLLLSQSLAGEFQGRQDLAVRALLELNCSHTAVEA